MTREIESLKEVLMHAIEQQKIYPESKTLPRLVKSMKRWLMKLHREDMKASIPSESVDTPQNVVA